MVSRLSYQPSAIYRNDIAKNLKTSSCSRKRIVLASSYIFERINIYSVPEKSSFLNICRTYALNLNQR